MIFNKLFRKQQPLPKWKRGQGFTYEVKGEANYQANLRNLAGPKEMRSKHLTCEALLVPEPSNPIDPNAVVVRVKGKTVGYLPAEFAPKYLTLLSKMGMPGASIRCNAQIVGGWINETSEGHYGVKLSFSNSFTLV